MEHLSKSDNRTEKRKLGDIGENIACEYLKNHKFTIVERNYLRKWGEIDIVALKADMYRFIEVKSVKVTHVTFDTVTHATDTYRPEENVHPWKIKRLHRAIQTYMLEKRINSDWQLDLITVKIDETKHIARVELIENII
ncbi:MAG: YraN family protein [Minisyncoccia bacterium]